MGQSILLFVAVLMIAANGARVVDFNWAKPYRILEERRASERLLLEPTLKCIIEYMGGFNKTKFTSPTVASQCDLASEWTKIKGPTIPVPVNAKVPVWTTLVSEKRLDVTLSFNEKTEEKRTTHFSWKTHQTLQYETEGSWFTIKCFENGRPTLTETFRGSYHETWKNCKN